VALFWLIVEALELAAVGAVAIVVVVFVWGMIDRALHGR